MKILFGKSNWEIMETPLREFIPRAVKDSFTVVEVYLPVRKESPAEIRRMVEDAGLQFIAQISSQGANLQEHLDSFKRYYEIACACHPLHINSHTGRDLFSFQDNIRLFETSFDLACQAKIPLYHENHRGRALFCVPACTAYLDQLPDLKITADFGHWFCVHESDLSDQPEGMERVMQASGYIHARVGDGECSQVSNPFLEGYRPYLERCLELWQHILALRQAEGCESFVVTPEFGPVPYMPLDTTTGEPAGDAWDINCQMRDWLMPRLLA